MSNFNNEEVRILAMLAEVREQKRLVEEVQRLQEERKKKEREEAEAKKLAEEERARADAEERKRLEARAVTADSDERQEVSEVLRLYFHQTEEPGTQWYCSAEVKLRSTT
ncbi:hypothetical protein M378DRAFT_17614 [Amanita muscaria Koide BX008]|uniref:Uncharacterized protein n=1 Tax=Amanita muscaria (strain Koide BX008) TaxID=946122 RepID=A0A0C2WGP6_AMAMK|nr:hypothetical protein M378DRAFT_17614 [Amanita muscaria Koide BX008]